MDNPSYKAVRSIAWNKDDQQVMNDMAKSKRIKTKLLRLLGEKAMESMDDQFKNSKSAT